MAEQAFLLHFPIGEHATQGRAHGARKEVLSQVADLYLKHTKPPPGLVVGLSAAERQAIHLACELFSEQRDEIGCQKFRLKCGEDRVLNDIKPYGRSHVAGSTFAVTRASIIVLPGLSVLGAAGTTADEARQKVLTSPRGSGRPVTRRNASPFELVADVRRQGFVDDPEIGHVDLNPLGSIANSIPTLTALGIRIFPPFAPSPHQAPPVERVVQDPNELLRIAPDCTRIPFATSRGGDTLEIQRLRDLDARSALGEVDVDPMDDIRLLRHDLEYAVDGPAGCILTDDLPITVGLAAREAAGEHRGLEPTERRVCELVVSSITSQRSVRIGDAWRDYLGVSNRAGGVSVPKEVFCELVYSPLLIENVPHGLMPDWWRKKLARGAPGHGPVV